MRVERRDLVPGMRRSLPWTAAPKRALLRAKGPFLGPKRSSERSCWSKLNRLAWPPTPKDYLNRRSFWITLRFGFSVHGDEADFDPLVEGGCNPLEHEQRVAFVVGVFQAANHRGGCTNPLRQFTWSEICRRAQVENPSGNLRVCKVFLIGGLLFRIALDILLV